MPHHVPFVSRLAVADETKTVPSPKVCVSQSFLGDSFIQKELDFPFFCAYNNIHCIQNARLGSGVSCMPVMAVSRAGTRATLN